MTPDYDIDHEAYSERGESGVSATFPVRIVERVETEWDDRYDADTKKYGDEYCELAHEGEYTIYRRLGNSLVNIDAYFHEDWNTAFEAPDEWVIEGRRYKRQDTPPGHREAERHGGPELNFNLIEAELIEAAKQRALEDSTHHVRVLADWFYRAAPATDRTPYGRWAYAPIKEALHDEAMKESSSVEWAVCYGGNPDEYGADIPPVGLYDVAEYDESSVVSSLSSELAAYAYGGMAAVTEQREKALETEAEAEDHIDQMEDR